MPVLKYKHKKSDNTYEWLPLVEKFILPSPLNADKLGGKNPSDFASIAQGTKADNALPSSGFTGAAILAKLLTVDGTTSKLDSDLLDGQEGSYYLNYNNLNNKPTTIDNANKLGNQVASYYLDYKNFNNTPATADDVSKLNGKTADYYLNYNNLNNKPVLLLGSGKFNSLAGITITHNDLGTDNYKVFISPTGTADGSIGEITIASKTNTTFKVQNTGDNTSSIFDWLIIKI